jgi:hypothetical protein
MAERMIFIESNTTGSGMLAPGTAAALGLRPVFLTSDPRDRQSGFHPICLDSGGSRDRTITVLIMDAARYNPFCLK